MINELKKYMENTPIEDLLNEWVNLDGYSKLSPSVDELMSEWSAYYDPGKIPKVKFEQPIVLENKTNKDSKFSESFFYL